MKRFGLRLRQAQLPLLLMGLRVGGMGSRFLLVLFITHFMGLASLGVYALVGVAVQLLPALVLGGLNNHLSRAAVGQSEREIARNVVQMWGWGHVAYIGLLPVALVAGWLSGQGLWVALAVLLIARLEQMNNESFQLLVNRASPAVAAWQQFCQTGAWVLLYMGVAYVFPSFCSLEALLGAWCLGQLVPLAMFFIFTRAWPWRQALSFPKLNWVMNQAKHSALLWVHSVADVLAQHADRLIISAMLGLELTGVYTFFWQIGNALRTLVYAGVYLPKRAGQIAAYQRGDVPEHRRQSLAIVKEVSAITAGMMLVGAAVLLVGHGYLNQPLISTHLGAGLLLLVGMWSRISVDTLAYGLFTAGRDKVFMGSTLLAIGLAWVLNLLLIPLLGLYGASLSFVAVALALGIWRGLQLKDVWK